MKTINKLKSLFAGYREPEISEFSATARGHDPHGERVYIRDENVNLELYEPKEDESNAANPEA